MTTRRLGRYELIERLGRGGMGEVWRARDPALRRDVAVKVLRREEGDDATLRDDFIARFLREARAAARLKHPNVVAIYDVGVEPEPYIVMEYVEGASLRSFIGDASITVAQRIAWLVDVATGLEAAHAMGLVHRDIKPDNVMITTDGRAKVLDFGVAKAVGEAERSSRPPPSKENAPQSFRTQEGRVIGTPKYMAPEQMTGDRIDARADQWAWACVAYELLLGSVPDRQEVALPISTTLAEVPFDFAAAACRARSIDPEKRFASMRGLLDAIKDEAVVRPTVSAGKTRGPDAPTVGEVRTGANPRRWRAALVALSSFTAASLAVFAWRAARTHGHGAGLEARAPHPGCVMTDLPPFAMRAAPSVTAPLRVDVAVTPVGLVATCFSHDFDAGSGHVDLLTITDEEVRSRETPSVAGLYAASSLLVSTPEGAHHYVVSDDLKQRAHVLVSWSIKDDSLTSIQRLHRPDGVVSADRIVGVYVAEARHEEFLTVVRTSDVPTRYSIIWYGGRTEGLAIYTTTTSSAPTLVGVASRGNRVMYAFLDEEALYVGAYTTRSETVETPDADWRDPLAAHVNRWLDEADPQPVAKSAGAATLVFGEDFAEIAWFDRSEARLRHAQVTLQVPHLDGGAVALTVGSSAPLGVTTDGSPPTLRFGGSRGVMMAWRDGTHVWFGEGKTVEEAALAAGSRSDGQADNGPWIGVSSRGPWIAWVSGGELRRATASCSP